jgi:hypothetical protein
VMTGAIHFVPWSKPTRIGQFWFFHTPVSHRPNSLATPLYSNWLTTLTCAPLPTS